MSARMALWLSILATGASCAKRDPLYCGLNMNDPRCVDDGGVGDVAAGFVTIGGTVTGLSGAGLVVQNNGGDDKLIGSSGAFRFATGIPMDSTYEVTVGTQPTNPSQMCTVTSGSGTAATDVNDVQVDCQTAAYTVGGTVIGCGSGCAGTLVLTDNGGDDKPIAANGAFTFATPVPSEAAYAVAVKGATGPSCMVAGGTGFVGNANISTVVVNCTPGTYTLGGMSPNGGVTGLNGTVTLHAAYANPATAADTIAVSTASFAFPSALANNQMWAITVSGQPMYPPAAQNCVVTAQAAGTINGANVSSVAVMCTNKQFAIGGTVNGMNGGTLVLHDPPNDDKTITSNGAFTFATPIVSGGTYAATVLTQPMGQFCTVTMGSGTVTNADINTIVVTCTDAGIKCGGTYCNNTQKCCNPAGNAQCIGVFQPCFALSLPCDDAADCAMGRKCCASLHNGNGNITSVQCSSTCGNQTAQMCDPGVVGECASGTCSAWNKLPGYYACQ